MKKENTEKKDLKAAKDNCFRLLKFRPRSEKEIKDRLRQNKFEVSVADEVVDYLKKHRLLNDEEFSLAWAKSRVLRPFGLRKIYFELKKKGIAKNTIEKTFSQIKENYSEEKVISEICEKKYPKLLEKDEKFKAKQKLYAYLVRRGFSPDLVSDIVGLL